VPRLLFLPRFKIETFSVDGPAAMKYHQSGERGVIAGRSPSMPPFPSLVPNNTSIQNVNTVNTVYHDEKQCIYDQTKDNCKFSDYAPQNS
jgi:hypothetical protein